MLSFNRSFLFGIVVLFALAACGGSGGGGDDGDGGTITPVARSAAAYGLTQVAEQVYLPIVDRNHITQLGVQNIGTAAATLSVEFIDSAGSTVYTADASLPAQGSHIFTVETYSVISPGTFVSAIVTADQELVATVLLQSATSEALFGLYMECPAARPRCTCWRYFGLS